jgi:hypothetical protein
MQTNHHTPSMGVTGLQSHGEMLVDCPRCGALKGQRCILPLVMWFCKERYAIAPIARPKYMDHIPSLRTPTPRKEKKATRGKKHESGWISTLCKNANHGRCFSVPCECVCHKRAN